MMLISVGSVIALSSALASMASAHMALNSPCPRYSPNCATKPPLPNGVASYDVDIKNPISSVQNGASMPLCKYSQAWPQPVASWTAGQPVTVTFQPGGAAHGGGHCQFSMSYDGGKTFAVIHEELEHCFFTGASSVNDPAVLQYTFNLPQTLPASKSAVFAWSWVNAIGNREFYMNCADVAISGSSSSYTGKKMTIANYPGYPTIPEFGGNSKTGLEYYTNQPSVTVTGNGGSAPAPGGNYTASPAPSASAAPSSVAPAPSSASHAVSSAPAIPSATPSAVHSGAPSAAVPSATAPRGDYATSPAAPPASRSAYASATSVAGVNRGAIVSDTSSACTSGLMQCSGSGYQICVGGVWSTEYACGVGTSCKGADGHIYCDFP